MNFCVGDCGNIIIAKLENEPKINDVVRIIIEYSNYEQTHDLIIKQPRVSGKLRKQIGLELVSTSISSRLAEYTLENIKNKNNNECEFIIL